MAAQKRLLLPASAAVPPLAGTATKGSNQSRCLEDMTMVREPVLTTVAIADLRPTQITVGMREVMAKRKHWSETGPRRAESFSAGT